MSLDPSRTSTRREFVTKAAYASPVLLTLPAVAAFAQSGSGGGGGGGGTACFTDQQRSDLLDRYFSEHPDADPTVFPPEVLAELEATYPNGQCDS